MSDPLEILLLCDYDERSAGTIVDHIKSFPKYSRHRFWVLSNRGDLPLGLELDRFDGIVLHYSLVISYDSFLSSQARSAIRRFRGFKAVYVQDDYRWVNRTVAAMQYLRINALFGLAPQEVMDRVYDPRVLPGVERVTVLAGYVPEQLTKIPAKPYAERPVDVGYRGRKLPAWIGTHAQEKWLIADRFLQDAAQYGLACDISYREADRIYGDAWIEFLRSCKAVLGTESGSSVCDFTGGIQERVETHERRDPTASFETLRELYFKDADGAVMMNIISPRCFEAAALRTLMILYEGRYSDALTPWRHYVPLRKDHANMDEIVAVLRDPVRWKGVVYCAYEEVALNPRYTFKEMVRQFDEVVERVAQNLPRRVSPVYTEETFAAAIASVRGLTKRRSGIISTAAARFAHFLEHTFSAQLSRLVRRFAGARARAIMKKAYFAVVHSLIALGTLLKRYSLLLRGLLVTLRGPMAWPFLQLPAPTGVKLLLLREIAALRQIEPRSLDDELFDIEVLFDDARQELLIEGIVPDGDTPSDKSVRPREPVSVNTRMNMPLAVHWRIRDEWRLAPHPDLPDEYDFPALRKSFSLDPEFAALVLSQCFPRIAHMTAQESLVSPKARNEGKAAQR